MLQSSIGLDCYLPKFNFPNDTIGVHLKKKKKVEKTFEMRLQK